MRLLSAKPDFQLLELVPCELMPHLNYFHMRLKDFFHRCLVEFSDFGFAKVLRSQFLQQRLVGRDLAYPFELNTFFVI